VRARYGIGALGESDDSPSREQIEAYTGIVIDERTSAVRARVDQVLTKQTVFLRFSIAPSDLQALIGASPFSELSREFAPGLLQTQPRPEWFRPEDAPDYLAGEASGRAILVDTTQSSSWTVFVVARS
jgi:hypothetical protein